MDRRDQQYPIGGYTDIDSIFIILMMKISSKRRFQFSFHKKNIKLSFMLALMIADDIIKGIIFGLIHSMKFGTDVLKSTQRSRFCGVEKEKKRKQYTDAQKAFS